MAPALLVLHILIALALVMIVLLQKSEGGALGMGGGGGMMGRGSANLLTRMTAWLAAAFFATSILLALLANPGARQRSIFEPPGAQPGVSAPQPQAPAKPGSGGASGSGLPPLPLPPAGPAMPTPPK